MYTYKIVIADDEAFIRMGIEKLLKQTFFNIAVTGTYTTGQEVLDHLAREEVDILISDIRMPQASGLDVAKYIREKGLVTRIVMITGFQDFSYAQRALEYQVDHLLLKPIDFEKLLSCVEQLMQSIQREAQKIYDKTRHTLMLHDLRCWDLAMLVSGELPSLPERRRQDLFGDERQRYAGWCALIRFSLESKPAGLDITGQFWRDCGEFQDDAIDVYCIADSWQGASFLMLSGEDEKGAKSRAETYACGVLRYLSEVCGAQASFVCDLYESVEGIHRDDSGDLSERYVECVLHKDAAGRRELLDTAERVCTVRQLSNMAVRSIQRLSGMYDLDFTPFLQQLENSVRKEEVMKILRSLDSVVGEQLAQPENVVNRIIEYIHLHFAEDITLDIVADRFNFSRSHLSRMFKNKTGERFVDFLGNIRLMHAKEMLLTGKYTVKQIAERVGYPNPRYFSTVFKEKTGMTPRQFVLESVQEGKNRS